MHAESRPLVVGLADAVIEHYARALVTHADNVALNGYDPEHDPHPCQLGGEAESSVGPTPPLDVDCRCGCETTSYDWNAWGRDPVWSLFGFEPAAGHRVHYSLEWYRPGLREFCWADSDRCIPEAMADQPICAFVVRAHEDLDGDGKFTVHEGLGLVDENGSTFLGYVAGTPGAGYRRVDARRGPGA